MSLGNLNGLTQSKNYIQRAEKVLPGYSSCYSRAPLCYARGSYPSYIERGDGCFIFDVDGNKYIDTTMGLCPVILGYSHKSTQQSIKKHLDHGPLFTLPHRLEVELAEKLVDIIPCAEKVRFGKNGADATSAAVRLSREYTGRDHVAMCGYHGWQDWYIITTDQNGGIPEYCNTLSHKFIYNDLESLDNLFKKYPEQIACVIMEPISVELPKEAYLQQVKELAHKHGAILIFDEIVTGFRWDLGGAQKIYNTTPDLATFSKAMANGMPISALVGRVDIMDHFAIGHAFWSTTYGNESLSMAVALETINYIETEGVIPFIWAQGNKLKKGNLDLVKRHNLSDFFDCIGEAPRTVQSFKNFSGEIDLAMKTLFQQECVKRGIITLGCHNVCYSHSDQIITQILSIYDEVLDFISQIYQRGDNFLQYLDGPQAEPVFKRI